MAHCSGSSPDRSTNNHRDRLHNEFAYLLDVNNNPLKSVYDKCWKHASKIVRAVQLRKKDF